MSTYRVLKIILCLLAVLYWPSSHAQSPIDNGVNLHDVPDGSHLIIRNPKSFRVVDRFDCWRFDGIHGLTHRADCIQPYSYLGSCFIYPLDLSSGEMDRLLSFVMGAGNYEVLSTQFFGVVYLGVDMLLRSSATGRRILISCNDEYTTVSDIRREVRWDWYFSYPEETATGSPYILY